MRKCIRTAAALLLALALAAGLFGCSKLTPIVSGGDKPHTTEPAATGSQTDTEDTQNMENAEDTGEQDWAGEEESSDPAPVETDPPVWEGPETVVYLAPYDALAVEYGGYFYYVDRDDNLCRTTTDMTDYTLFCEAQIRGDVRIIGITDAGRMYLSSGGQSCYVDLAEGRDGMAADYGMVESQTFTGAALSIGIRALRGTPNFTAEQSETVARSTTPMKTYIDENIMYFIDGTRDMSEWDSFVEETLALGDMDEVLATYEAADQVIYSTERRYATYN